MSNTRRRIPIQVIALMAVSFVLPMILFSTQKWTLWFEKGNIVWMALLSAFVFGGAQYLLCSKVYPASSLKFAAFSMIGSMFSLLFGL